MIDFNLNWHNEYDLTARQYVCSYCSNDIASARGFLAKQGSGQGIAAGYLYICHRCSGPTFFDRDGNQFPAATFGNPVEHIPDKDVEALYEEARRSTGSGAYTAAVLCCRKLLMHIAVSKGADEGKKFVQYVEYLAEKHYVPPDAIEWVDHIREKGNEANHEIVLMEPEEAKNLLKFSEMLLKIIFEFPATVVKKGQEVIGGSGDHA